MFMSGVKMKYKDSKPKFSRKIKMSIEIAAG
jgi:hypothetical protein